MVRINNELIQTAIGTVTLKKRGQVRPTSEKCGKWIRVYPKEKKKPKKKGKGGGQTRTDGVQ